MKTINTTTLLTTLLFLNIFCFQQFNAIIVPTADDLQALNPRTARDIHARVLPAADDLQAVVLPTARDVQALDFPTADVLQNPNIRIARDVQAKVLPSAKDLQTVALRIAPDILDYISPDDFKAVVERTFAQLEDLVGAYGDHVSALNNAMAAGLQSIHESAIQKLEEVLDE